MEAHGQARDLVTKMSAIEQSTRALNAAGMTVVTNPNLNFSTWIPNLAYDGHETVYLACHQEIPSADCMSLCQQWRAGTRIHCALEHRFRGHSTLLRTHTKGSASGAL